MRIKLDENIHRDAAVALADLGHDVTTVGDEGLAGRPDADIAQAVRAERRCLVTFDLGFADTRLCPPSQFDGLVVLRLGAPSSRNQVACLTRFFAEITDIAGRLWIVEDSRARDWTPWTVSEQAREYGWTPDSWTPEPAV